MHRDFARSGNRGSVVMVVPGRCRRCTAALRDRPPDFPPTLVLMSGPLAVTIDSQLSVGGRSPRSAHRLALAIAALSGVHDTSVDSDWGALPSSCDGSLLAAAATGATRPGRLRWLAAHCDCTRSFAAISPGSPQPQPTHWQPHSSRYVGGRVLCRVVCRVERCFALAEVLRAPCEAMLRVRTHWRSPSRRHRCMQRVLNGHGCSHTPSPMAVSCHGPHWSRLATPTRATCNECHLPVPQHPLELSSQVIVLALPLA